MTDYHGQIDGIPGTLSVGPHGLDTAGGLLPWADMDGVSVHGHTIELTMYDAPTVTLSMLAARTDAFVAELTSARSQARRAALLQWTGTPEVATFTQAPGSPDHDPVGIHVFADGFTVEPRGGVPELVPYALITDVIRDGYRITFHRRGLTDVTVCRLGPRTDEFLDVIDRYRSAENAAMAAAFASMDDRLAGLSTPNGWAIPLREARAFGGAIAEAFAAGGRAEELDTLIDLTGAGIRYGISLQPAAPMPFVLATGRAATAVESVGNDEARATYVFATSDADAINRALVMLSFRREAVYLPRDRLGRWTLAARTLPIVAWARSVFATRVIHDENWAATVTKALS